VTRSITVREPEYTPQDQALMVADWYEQREPKNGYGIPITEATDPANAQAFVVPYPRRDFAAQAAGRARKQYEKDYPHDDPSSLLWRVERAEPTTE
jgi:hypothetical protein